MSILKKIVIFVSAIFTHYPSLIILNISFIIVSALIGSASIFSLAPIVDTLLKNQTEATSSITKYFLEVFHILGIPTTLTSFLLVFLAIHLLKNGVLTFSHYIIIRTQFSVMRNLINETYKVCFNTRWYFFSENNMGMLFNTFNDEIRMVGLAFAMTARLFADLMRAGFYFLIPFIISWQATTICILFLIVLSLPLQWLTRLSYQFGRQRTSTKNHYMDVIQETFRSAKLILGFGNQGKNITAVNHSFYQHRTAMVRSQMMNKIVRALYETIFIGGLLLIIYLIFYRYSIPLTETLVMYYAFQSLMPLFGQINSSYHTVINYLPSYEQMMQVQALAKQHVQPTGTRPFTQLKEGVLLKDISFAYLDRAPLLHDIHISIPKGKMIALVGGSGAGKTTLLDLLVGFYEPMKGTITIDGIPLSDYNIITFRQKIGLVPQDIILFNMSVRNNLLWSHTHASQQELDDACKLANAYDFIMELPQEYDTVVGDQGVRLSVGQRQRIALARAVLRKPEMLLLDEATSALDSQSERLIQQAIENIAQKTTVVVIAHRLSTITRADYIYVLDRGTIVEEGTFDSLIERKGVFNRMVELQKL